MVARPLHDGLIALVVSLAFMAVAFSIMLAERLHDETAAALLLCGFGLAVHMLTLRILEPSPALPSLFCLFYFAFFYALPGVVQVSSHTFFWSRIVYPPEATFRAALMAPLFLCGFAIGQRLARMPAAIRVAREAIAASERSPRLFSITFFILLAIGLGWQCWRRFEDALLLSSRREFSDQVMSALSQLEIGVWLQLPRAMTMTAMLVGVYAIVRWRKEHPRALFLAIPLTLALAPLFAVVNWPPALPRNWQFAILISALVTFVTVWSPRVRALLVAAMLLSTFSVFQWLNVLRSGVDDPSFRFLGPVDYLKHGDFDGVQTTINAVLYADATGHSFGKMLLSSALFFVPRSIWPGKAISSGQATSLALGYDFTNLSMPLPAECYLEFAFLGVVAGGVAVGWLYRRLDAVCAAALERGDVTLHRILIAVICGFTILVMRGALYAITPVVLPVVSLVALLIAAPTAARFVIGERKRARAPLPVVVKPPPGRPPG